MRSIKKMTKNRGDSAITVINPELFYTAEPTPPSSVFHATRKFTRPTNSFQSTPGHFSVTPATNPLLLSFAKPSNLFFARIVIGKTTGFPRLLCITGGLLKGLLGVLP